MGLLKFVSRVLLSLVMEKDARVKLERWRKAGKNTTRENQTKAMQENARTVMTPERQELIRNALKVHRAKSKIIEDLKDEDKQRLYALAVKKLLREDEGKNGT